MFRFIISSLFAVFFGFNLHSADNFWEADEVSGGQVTFEGSFAGMTIIPGEFSPCGVQATTWHKWIAPSDGEIEISAPTNSFGVVFVSVFSGESSPNELLATSRYTYGDRCHQFCSGLDRITMDVSSGAIYWIQIAGEGGDYQVRLRLFDRPVNDRFENRLSISGVSATFHVNTFGATDDEDNPEILNEGGGATKTVWYEWVAPFSGRASLGLVDRSVSDPGNWTRDVGNDIFSVKNSYFDIIIEPPNPCGSWFPPATPEVYSPFLGAFRGASFDELFSLYQGVEVYFNAEEGIKYFFAVGGNSQTRGECDLHLLLTKRPQNDHIENRTALSGKRIVNRGNTRGASREPGETGYFTMNPGASIWWSWSADEDGIMDLNVRDVLGNPLVIVVWQRTEISNLVQRAVGEEGILMPVKKGEMFAIAAYGRSGLTPGTLYEGPVELSLNLKTSAVGIAVDLKRAADGLSLKYYVSGPIDQRVGIEGSWDLVDWRQIDSGVIGSNGYEFEAPVNPVSQFFVRAVPLP